ncbi:hypothetical protein DYB37_012266 [Aphanomyces astaci]|uniref:Retrotransposon gag domain-containing protein n=1 Tax=Aphanomyces astaci TaxID=112090 RepID=A0A3R7BH02_APHAT|nr:hypothetical protein DYB37_012266 [Aphanomyces astaci]
MTLTQERAQSGEDPSPETRDQLERKRHANEEVLRQVEEARCCLETEILQLRDQEATLFRERSVQDLTLSRAYAELERHRVHLQVEQRTVDLQQRTPQKTNNAPYATYGIPTLSRMGPGAATGVVTQVERILPHLLEVDRMGVIMVDPSVAEVALRDLLVVEDLEGTTVVLLALREAAPEETALYAPKFDSVDRTIPLEHFLAKFDTIQKEYGLNDTQVVRIFDDRLTSCGVLSVQDWWARRCRDSEPVSWVEAREAFRKEFIQKTLITDNSHRETTETVRDDAEVAACLRGASVRPETIEISLDYLIERDVDIDRPTDGSRSAPRTTPVAPSTPTRSTRNTSRTQSSSTPNGNLQELQASISRLQRDMTSLTTSKNDQFSSIQDVVAMISTDNPAGNNPPVPGQRRSGVRDKPERDPDDDQDPEDEEEMQPVTPVGRWAI